MLKMFFFYNHFFKKIDEFSISQLFAVVLPILNVVVLLLMLVLFVFLSLILDSIILLLVIDVGANLVP